MRHSLMEYNRLLMHTKNLLELVDAGIPCSTSFPEYIIAKKEIEEDERAIPLIAPIREMTKEEFEEMYPRESDRYYPEIIIKQF